jgi:sarcosine oxidase subunit gamma
VSKPERLSVLLGHLAPGHHGASGSEPVRLGEIVLEATEMAARKGQAVAVREAALTALGLDLPPIGGWREANGVTALALAPDAWLLLSRGGVPAFSPAACFIEVGHGLACLELSGRAARHVLAKGCRLDLHPAVFLPGHCARTIIAQVTVTLWQVDRRPTFRLAVPLTFAQTFLHFLLAASAETGCEILPAAKD